MKKLGRQVIMGIDQTAQARNATMAEEAARN
jgi:hypothetical protein